MKQSSSNRKVNEQAREVIAGILLFEISDPRLELVTITGCEVSYDRSVCNVFYTTEPDRYEDVAAAFQKASGRIRSLMARKLSWRIAPELRFLLDKSVGRLRQFIRPYVARLRHTQKNAGAFQLPGVVLAELLKVMTSNPSDLYGFDAGYLVENGPAAILQRC